MNFNIQQYGQNNWSIIAHKIFERPPIHRAFHKRLPQMHTRLLTLVINIMFSPTIFNINHNPTFF